jgi:hypothetical protein
MKAAIKWIVHFVGTGSVGHVSALGLRNAGSTNVDTNRISLPVTLLWKQRYGFIFIFFKQKRKKKKDIWVYLSRGQGNVDR